jgi:hypothetical protein
MKTMSELCYKVEPEYCGECQLFRSLSADGEGVCGFDGDGTWHGEIACDNFKMREDEGDE